MDYTWIVVEVSVIVLGIFIFLQFKGIPLLLDAFLEDFSHTFAEGTEKIQKEMELAQEEAVSKIKNVDVASTGGLASVMAKKNRKLDQLIGDELAAFGQDPIMEMIISKTPILGAFLDDNPEMIGPFMNHPIVQQIFGALKEKTKTLAGVKSPAQQPPGQTGW